MPDICWVFEVDKLAEQQHARASLQLLLVNPDPDLLTMCLQAELHARIEEVAALKEKLQATQKQAQAQLIRAASSATLASKRLSVLQQVGHDVLAHPGHLTFERRC